MILISIVYQFHRVCQANCYQSFEEVLMGILFLEGVYCQFIVQGAPFKNRHEIPNEILK